MSTTYEERLQAARAAVAALKEGDKLYHIVESHKERWRLEERTIIAIGEYPERLRNLPGKHRRLYEAGGIVVNEAFTNWHESEMCGWVLSSSVFKVFTTPEAALEEFIRGKRDSAEHHIRLAQQCRAEADWAERDLIARRGGRS